MEPWSLQTFIDSIEDALVVIDENFRVVLANAATLRIFGRTAGELLGQHCYSSFHGRTIPCEGQPFGDCPLKTVMATGQSARVRHHHPDTSGSVHVVEVFAAPLPDRKDGPSLFLEQMHEVTRQAELEMETAQRHRELTEANLRLRSLEQARRQALQRAITAQEDERKRIAAELHDDTVQALAALIMGLDTAAAMLEHSPAAAREQLVHLKRATGAIIEEIDTIIAALRPALLDDLGLLPALTAYAAERLDPLGVAWELHAEGLQCRLPPATEMVFFRVVQEAISNIARHARAHQVQITIAPEEGGTVVQVSDDGVGFDVAEKFDPGRRQPSLGLFGMQERLAAVNGQLTIQSSPGKGTLLRIFVPCQAEEEHP